MNKEEFKQKTDEINNSIALLYLELKALKDDYIIDNREFQDMDKVLITKRNDKTELAFIEKAKVNSVNEIEYRFLKCKNDGTPSKQGLYAYGSKKIEKI